jgi:hypothetical protein
LKDEQELEREDRAQKTALERKEDIDNANPNVRF